METEQPGQENFEGQAEQTKEEILDALEVAFERGVRAELTVLEPSGEIRTNAVFIEGLDGGTLFVAESKSSPVMGISIESVKKAKALQKEKEVRENPITD